MTDLIAAIEVVLLSRLVVVVVVVCRKTPLVVEGHEAVGEAVGDGGRCCGGSS